MSVAVHNTNHAGDAVGKLLGWLKSKANLNTIITAIVSEVQAAEDMLWTLLTLRDIQNSSGAQLDGMGDLLNLPRSGLVDSAYRVQLQAKILLDISSGGINEVLQLMSMIIPGALLTMFQAYPASFTITTSVTPSDPPTAGSILRSATVAGVSSQLIYSTTDLGHTFTTSDSNLGLVASTSLGFADSANPGTGGHLAGSA